MKNYAIVTGMIAVIITILLWTTIPHVAKAPSPVACTQEAKLCPDGSAVGRTGPNCEFAECPVPASGPISLGAVIGEKVSGLDVSITPLAVLQDSRCPIDVQCIQAGTVKLQARLVSGLGTTTQTFTLGQPITTEAETITLTDVLPPPKAGIQIKNSDYIFTFGIAKRTATIPASASGVRGTVLLGPTCPVQRIPPDPQCADKPYATNIAVYRAGVSTALTTGKSDATGAFSFSLPPGSYTLVISGATMSLPRCNDTNVTVQPNAYATADISCDTGIR
ncbi:MAG: hypothetical protein WCT41_03755 [Candidatus Paceibacterota bacterium]|jgi:hypothetical protein